MPVGLEQAYDRDLSHVEKLDEDERIRATNILRWVLFAVRPLTVREMVEALILDGNIDDDDEYPEDELPDSWKINYVDEDYVNDVLRQPLGSLIELKSCGENEPLSAYTVHFVHYSVKEYLLRPNESGISPALKLCFPDSKSENDRLAKLCLRYLCYDVFGDDESSVSTRKKINSYPFLLYAARTWYQHALTNARVSPDIVHCARKLLDPATSNWVMWSKVFEGKDDFEVEVDDSDSESNIDRDESIHTATSPMYYACLLGLLDVAKSLHSDGLDVNSQGGTYGTPLQAAVAKGHFDTVKFLIENGADVFLQGGIFLHAICAAAYGGNVDIFKLLVESGADLESQDETGLRPVHLGISHPQILRTCLEKDVDINARDNKGKTPLFWAGFYGSIESARILIDAGADIDAKVEYYGSAIFAGIYNDHLEFIRLLLIRGANLDIHDDYERTCLHEAVQYGRDRTIELLLEHGANVEATNMRGRTPLGFASLSPGRPSSAKILLEHGADVDHSDNYGCTALHIAAELGNEELVKLYLDYGADIDPESSSSTTPLMHAAIGGSLSVVKILLEHGADPGKYDINGDTSLDHAIQKRNNEIILFFMGQNVLSASSTDSHVDIDPNDKEQNMEFNKAIFTNDRDKVETMFDRILSSKTAISLDTAIHTAAIGGSTEMTKFLLDKGTSVHSTTSNRRTALHYAAFHGHLEVVKVLLDSGADPYARDVSHSLPLDLAVQGGFNNTAVVKYLIQKYGFGPNYPKPDPDFLEACKYSQKSSSPETIQEKKRPIAGN